MLVARPGGGTRGLGSSRLSPRPQNEAKALGFGAGRELGCPDKWRQQGQKLRWQLLGFCSNNQALLSHYLDPILISWEAQSAGTVADQKHGDWGGRLCALRGHGTAWAGSASSEPADQAAGGAAPAAQGETRLHGGRRLPGFRLEPLAAPRQGPGRCLLADALLADALLPCPAIPPPAQVPDTAERQAALSGEVAALKRQAAALNHPETFAQAGRAQWCGGMVDFQPSVRSKPEQEAA